MPKYKVVCSRTITEYVTFANIEAPNEYAAHDIAAKKWVADEPCTEYVCEDDGNTLFEVTGKDGVIHRF